MMSSLKMIFFGGIIILAQAGAACPNLTGEYRCPYYIKMTISQSLDKTGHTVFTIDDGFVHIMRADGVVYRFPGDHENVASYDQAYRCSGSTLSGAGKLEVISGNNTGNVKFANYYYTKTFKLNAAGDIVVSDNGKMTLWAGTTFRAKEVIRVCVREK